MATIRKSVTIAKSASDVWDAVSDHGQLHTRLVPGMVTNTVLEQDGEIRIVTFANGMVLKEDMISSDNATMRLAWSAQSDQWTHHNAGLQVIALDNNKCELVWTADVLPHSAGALMEQFLSAGLGATKAHMEAG